MEAAYNVGDVVRHRTSQTVGLIIAHLAAYGAGHLYLVSYDFKRRAWVREMEIERLPPPPV
jgi:hypothetical protein